MKIKIEQNQVFLGSFKRLSVSESEEDEGLFNVDLKFSIDWLLILTTFGDLNNEDDEETLGLGLAAENVPGLGVAAENLAGLGLGVADPEVLILSLASSRRRAAGDIELSLSLIDGDADDDVLGEGTKNRCICFIAWSFRFRLSLLAFSSRFNAIFSRSGIDGILNSGPLSIEKKRG